MSSLWWLFKRKKLKNGLKPAFGEFQIAIRKRFFTERWSSAGKSSPEKWSWLHDCWCSRTIWTVLLTSGLPFVESEGQFSWSVCASSNLGYPVILFVFCRLQLLVKVGPRGRQWGTAGGWGHNSFQPSYLLFFANLGHETTDAQSLLNR